MDKALQTMINNMPSNWKHDLEYDLEDKTCGDLVIALFKIFKPLQTGKIVCVSANYLEAAADITSWCNSTNKELMDSQPPFYLIRK